MVVLKSYASQNGRWGLQLLGPDNLKDTRQYWRMSYEDFTVQNLGTVNGRSIWELVPSEGTSVILSDDAYSTVAGCIIAEKISLQGGKNIAILLAKPGAIWFCTGYRGRSSWYEGLSPDGQITRVPEGVLVAAGLVTPKPPANPNPVKVMSPSQEICNAWREE